MSDWITCRSGLPLDTRRRLGTTRTVCCTMVVIDFQTVPVLCPTCGSRVI